MQVVRLPVTCVIVGPLVMRSEVLLAISETLVMWKIVHQTSQIKSQMITMTVYPMIICSCEL